MPKRKMSVKKHPVRWRVAIVFGVFLALPLIDMTLEQIERYQEFKRRREILNNPMTGIIEAKLNQRRP